MEISNSKQKINIIEKVILAIDDLFPIFDRSNLEICNKYIFHSVSILGFANEHNISQEKTEKLRDKMNKYIVENKEIVPEILKLTKGRETLRMISIDIKNENGT